MTTKAERAKDLRLRREFQITLANHNLAWQLQGYKCGICQRSHNKKGELLRLAVDHDHVTGLLRGLLCMTCNKGLALFQDNSLFLSNAANYIDFPTFTKVFGKNKYTIPGKVGTKKRKKLLAFAKEARERDGKEKELQKRKSSKK